jgi:hypothetical protein
MTSTESIRNRFETDFQERLNTAGLAVIPRWFGPVFPEDSLIAAWKAEAVERTLRLQVRETGDAIRFDWVVGRSGEDREFEDLLLAIVPEALGTEVILTIYQLWLIDRATVRDVTMALEEIEMRLRN